MSRHDTYDHKENIVGSLAVDLNSVVRLLYFPSSFFYLQLVSYLRWRQACSIIHFFAQNLAKIRPGNPTRTGSYMLVKNVTATTHHTIFLLPSSLSCAEWFIFSFNFHPTSQRAHQQTKPCNLASSLVEECWLVHLYNTLWLLHCAFVSCCCWRFCCEDHHKSLVVPEHGILE